MTALETPVHVDREHVYDFDIYNDAQLLSDLHASYARLHREAPPVFWTPRNGGHWIVTRHNEMVEIVGDPEYFSASEMQIPRIPNPPRFLPLNVDPPESVKYRQLLMPFFAPKSINAMADRIRGHARRIVGAVAGRGECEFVHEVAAIFPVTVFMEMMGFPMEKLEDFRQKAEDFFYSRSEAETQRTIGIIVDEMKLLIEERRKDPKQDLLSHLVTARVDDGRELTMQELTDMCMLLFVGGLDTVTNQLSFGTRLLAERPDLQQRLLDEPDKIKDFVEESIRMYGVSNTPRLVAKDCERFGVRFRAGEMVLCVLTLSGWDDRHNADPANFDLDRSSRTQLIFSSGPHLCVGHFLARLEEQIFYTEWMQQVGKFQLAEGYKPSYRAGTVMSLEKLNLTWTPGQG